LQLLIVVQLIFSSPAVQPMLPPLYPVRWNDRPANLVNLYTRIWTICSFLAFLLR